MMVCKEADIDRETLAANIDAVLAAGAVSSDARHYGLIQLAFERGLTDRGLALFALYRPIGASSEDNWPQVAAREHAEACEDAGRLGCVLQLQTRVMGGSQAFSSLEWSRYGKFRAASCVADVAATGIDVDSFLMGLLFDYQAPADRPVHLSLGRLGRAIAESDRRDALLSELESRAQDPELDAWNRLRAAVVLHHTWAHAGINRQLGELDLDAFSRLWVEAT